MSDDADILVRYVRNADETHGTESITFNDDDRPDLVIGGAGYVTEEERHRLSTFGIVLEPVTKDDLVELNVALPEIKDDEPKALADLSQSELLQIAKDEGVDLSGKRSNAARAEAIEEHRSNLNSGQASLPATVSVGPPASGSQEAV